MPRSICTLFAVSFFPLNRPTLPSSRILPFLTRCVPPSIDPGAQHRPVCDARAVWLHAGESVPALADNISAPLVRRAPWAADVRLCAGHAPEGWVRLGALDGARPPVAVAGSCFYGLGEKDGDLTEQGVAGEGGLALLRAQIPVVPSTGRGERVRDPALRARAYVPAAGVCMRVCV